MSISSLYPSISPSLLLDFANTKQLDPRITFSRPTTATYYDGKTTAIAEQNLLTYSQEFNTPAWSANNNITVTADQATAPDGTLTADKLTATSISDPYIGQAVNLPYASGSFTFSVYLWTDAGQPKTAGLYIFKATDNTGSGVVQVATTGITLTTTPTKYSVTQNFTYDGTTPYVICRIDLAQTDNSGAVANEYVYAWGAQLSQTSAPIGYNATTSATVPASYIPIMLTASANIARFDNNPTTGESLGLLIEEQRTNLMTYSSNLSDSSWIKENAPIISNFVTAPDGTATGNKITDNSTSARHDFYKAFTPSTSSFTISIYAKYVNIPWIYIGYFVYGCAFNIQTGVAGTPSANAANPKITPVGNGWYRCSINITNSVGADGIFVGLSTNGTYQQVYSGNGSSAYLWGVQVENGSFVTSYIPTQASQVTRSADSASMTGSNFSSWCRADEGTLYAEASSPSTLLPLTLQSDLNSSIYVANRASGVSGTPGNIYINTVQQTSFGNFTFAASNKTTLAYKTNDAAATINGNTVSTDNTVSLPVPTQALIGSQGSTTYTGTIKRLAFYPARLTNAQLQAITS